MFNKKEIQNLFEVTKIKIDNYVIYSVHSDVAYNYNRDVNFNESVYNVYVDKENKILHIFDPLGHGYLNHARSVINTVSQQYIDELRKALKVKRGKYDVYIYMHPVHDVTSFKSAYSYKLDDFIGIDETKEFNYFKELGNQRAEFIF